MSWKWQFWAQNWKKLAQKCNILAKKAHFCKQPFKKLSSIKMWYVIFHQSIVQFKHKPSLVPSPPKAIKAGEQNATVWQDTGKKLIPLVVTVSMRALLKLPWKCSEMRWHREKNLKILGQKWRNFEKSKCLFTKRKNTYTLIPKFLKSCIRNMEKVKSIPILLAPEPLSFHLQ